MVPATAISASECGQYVTTEYDAKGQRVSRPTAPAYQIKVCVHSSSPSPEGDLVDPQDAAVEEAPVDEVSVEHQKP